MQWSLWYKAWGFGIAGMALAVMAPMWVYAPDLCELSQQQQASRLQQAKIREQVRIQKIKLMRYRSLCVG